MHIFCYIWLNFYVVLTKIIILQFYNCFIVVKTDRYLHMKIECFAGTLIILPNMSL